MFTYKDLAQYTGTHEYHIHWLGTLAYTDGIDFLVKNGASWLVDAIASHQTKKLHEAIPFEDVQLWTVVVHLPERNATLQCLTSTGLAVVQEIDYTDLCVPKISLKLVQGILMLPSED